MDPNRPLYKPEFWDKVQDLDRNTNTLDPIFKCQPYGVPRMGPPTKMMYQVWKTMPYMAKVELRDLPLP